MAPYFCDRNTTKFSFALTVETGRVFVLPSPFKGPWPHLRVVRQATTWAEECSALVIHYFHLRKVETSSKNLQSLYLELMAELASTLVGE